MSYNSTKFPNTCLFCNLQPVSGSKFLQMLMKKFNFAKTMQSLLLKLQWVFFATFLFCGEFSFLYFDKLLAYDELLPMSYTGRVFRIPWEYHLVKHSPTQSLNLTANRQIIFVSKFSFLGPKYRTKV